MELNFKAEIGKIKQHNIDIAFFPVDARLMESYALGGEYFLKEIKPKYFIPMHFREDYYITKEFSDRNKNNSAKVFEISSRGEEIII
jgi:L-ascorbate metabolism protein UlaG (beta-lactamase superfamily)